MIEKIGLAVLLIPFAILGLLVIAAASGGLVAWPQASRSPPSPSA